MCSKWKQSHSNIHILYVFHQNNQFGNTNYGPGLLFEHKICGGGNFVFKCHIGLFQIYIYCMFSIKIINLATPIMDLVFYLNTKYVTEVILCSNAMSGCFKYTYIICFLTIRKYLTSRSFNLKESKLLCFLRKVNKSRFWISRFKH